MTVCRRFVVRYISGAVWALIATAAHSAEMPITVLPAGHKAAIRFLQPRVAAGAIANVAHQAPFEVLVTDANDKPKAGVEVALPIVIKGGRAPENHEPPSARVRWISSGAPNTANGGDAQSGPPVGIALTDAHGIARGLFTSGHRTEKTTIQLRIGLKGGPTAEIEQVWNGLKDDNRWGDESLEAGTGTRVLYRMRYCRHADTEKEKPKEEWEPITGHRMSVTLEKMTIHLWHADRGPDEDGDGEPDGMSEEKVISHNDADKTEWNRYLQYVEIQPVREIAAGDYSTILRFNIPKDDQGEELFSVSDYSYDIWDDGVYDEAGKED